MRLLWRRQIPLEFVISDPVERVDEKETRVCGPLGACSRGRLARAQTVLFFSGISARASDYSQQGRAQRTVLQLYIRVTKYLRYSKVRPLVLAILRPDVLLIQTLPISWRWA